jgi:hypothetical protein
VKNVDKKSWLIPYEILQEYLKTHQHLFDLNVKGEENHSMKAEIDSQVKGIRIAQILINNGWEFIDNGYNRVESVYNNNTKETNKFESNLEFIIWLNKEGEKYGI